MSPNRTEQFQFLTVRLDQVIFAFDIKKVKELIDPVPITQVPRMPGYMLGAINLRGEVVPVMDLCLRFGIDQTAQSVDTSIAIVETGQGEETCWLGVRVDAVDQVLSLDNDLILAPPDMGLNIPKRFIRAVGQTKDEFIIILDIDRLLPE
ncbi:chemotaxis protein CheW [Desulfobacter sp.]|uniref:chemotaxis protein CheW n=1 Tax=Desulfobacter sp. TaxID=2294 RepID=UPI003D0EC235